MVISVIIPVYNTAPYIQECIRSVLNQTYHQLEIIVIDDCGTDNSIGIIRRNLKYFGSHRKIKIIKHPYNKGLSASRNTGIKHAKGNYIFFLDSDDFLPSDAIENLVKLQNKYPNADIIYGLFQSYPDNWFKYENDTIQKLDEHYTTKSKIKSLILNRSIIPEQQCNKLYKTDFIKKNKLYFKEGIIHEDTHYTFFTAKYANEIAFYKGTTYYYRKNTNGIMSSSQIVRRTKCLDIIIKDCIKNINTKAVYAQLLFIIHLIHTNLFLRKRFSAHTSKIKKTLQILRYLTGIALKKN